MTVAEHARTTASIERVDREIEFATDERDAFVRFRSRLDGLEPANGPAAALAGGETGAAGTLAVTDPPRDAGLDAVRTAYRETVMAVPHYEAEYDDGLRENVAVEFGPDVAASIVDCRSLTPFAMDALESACEKAVRERREFLRVLRHERESLGDVRDELRDVERSLATVEATIDEAASSTELGRLDGRLSELENRCSALAERRQRLHHGRSAPVISGVDDVSLTRYLYRDRDARCPALADVADHLDAIRDLRTLCLR